jgi:S1-C subfamily serine protease
MKAWLSRRANLAAVLVAGALFFTALGFFVATGVNRPTVSHAENLWTNGPGTVVATVSGPNFAPIAQKLAPSVVRIVVEGQPVTNDTTLPGTTPDTTPGTTPDTTLPPGHPALTAEGTGVILTADGYILTNKHVIEGATKITVTLTNGHDYQGTTLGSDTRDDLAVVKINPTETLQPAPLGNSDNMRAADWVMAMGNPLGFDYSVTVGVVSAKGRSLPSSNFGAYIQTDAAIYPGNSGGPLVNLAGEVIGINTAVIPNTNLGFAIPINTAKDIIPQLVKGGKVVRGYLGVSIQSVADLSPKPTGAPGSGAAVMQVNPGTPGEAAGLKVGDVVVTFDGQPVATAQNLTQFVTSTAPGTKVTLGIVRGGASQQVVVTLGSLPSSLE